MVGRAEREAEPEAKGDAEGVRLWRGEALSVTGALRVGLAEGGAETVGAAGVPEGEAEGGEVGVGGVLPVPLGLAQGVGVALRSGVRVAQGEAEGVGAGVGEAAPEKLGAEGVGRPL